jgi:glutaredoxin
MEKITMYSTQWCGDCRVAKRFLTEKRIPFDEIDIDRDSAAADRVIRWSGGRRVIPTFHIECSGTQDTIVLHNPGLTALNELFSR